LIASVDSVSVSGFRGLDRVGRDSKLFRAEAGPCTSWAEN